MISNEIVKYPVGTEFVVIDPRQSHRNKYEGTIAEVEPKRVVRVKKASNLQFVPDQVARELGNLSVAQDKKIGYAVDMNTDSTPLYRTISSKDFICTTEEYEKVWKPILEQRKADEAEKQRVAQLRAEQERKEDEYASAQKEVLKSQADELERSIGSSLRLVLKKIDENRYRSYVDIRSGWRTVPASKPDANGLYPREFVTEDASVVSLSMQDFQRLLEKAINNG